MILKKIIRMNFIDFKRRFTFKSSNLDLLKFKFACGFPCEEINLFSYFSR